MCPVASLIQQFSRREVDHRRQPGLYVLPKQYILLPLSETKHLAKMDCWSDPGGHFVCSCATGNKSHSAVTLRADVFPIRCPFLIRSRLPNIIRSGLTTFLNICYYCPAPPKKGGFIFLNSHFQLTVIKILFIGFLVCGFRAHLLNIFKLFCIIRVAEHTSP